MIVRLALGSVVATGAALGADALGRAAAADPAGTAAEVRMVLALVVVVCVFGILFTLRGGARR